MTAPHEFATTRWTVVQAAAHQSSGTARVALEELCETYWPPVYAFLRRRGKTTVDAEDLTQAFFVHLLDSGFVQAADRERGRFRSLLLKSVANFVRADNRARNALKRGNGTRILSLNIADGEKHYDLEKCSSVTAEQVFERRWALTLLEKTVGQLRQEYADRHHALLFDCLEAHLNQQPDRLPYAELSERLDMSEEAIRQAARRLKLRYREILRREIADTVSSVDQIDDELRQLMQALSNS